ncbi:MAG: restriction endonuclease subunit S [Rhodanobacteraceae bacterium]
MAGEWRDGPLSELCTYINRGAAPAYVETGGILVLNQKCVRDQRVSFAEVRRTDNLRKPISRERMLQPFDIIVNSTGIGTLGRVAQINFLPEPSTVDSHVTVVRPDPEAINPRYLGYAVRCFEPEIEELGEGSTGQTELARSRLADFIVPIPPADEQCAIAHILGTLDDKIELNRRISETLETMVRALFKSLFVDFDPVRAKMEGRWQRSQSLPGLPAHLYDLFPDRLVDSELGQAPEGWPVECLGDHVDGERGLSYKGEGLRDDGTGLPMHNLNSIYEGGGYKHEGIKFYGGEYREKHVLAPGDLIMTNTEQGFDHLLVGHAAIVPETYGPRGLYSHHIFHIRAKPGSPLTPHYLLRLFNHPRWHQLISGFSNGTTINMLPSDALVIPRIIVPPAPIIDVFSRIASDVHARVEASRAESLTLASQRDALLPKLISGELGVGGAEGVLQSAG